MGLGPRSPLLRQHDPVIFGQAAECGGSRSGKGQLLLLVPALVSLTVYSLLWNKNRPIFALLRLLHHLLQSTPPLPPPPASPPSPLLRLPARETPLQARPSRSRGRAYTRGMAPRNLSVRLTRQPRQQHSMRAHTTKSRLWERRPERRDPDAFDACY